MLDTLVNSSKDFKTSAKESFFFAPPISPSSFFHSCYNKHFACRQLFTSILLFNLPKMPPCTFRVSAETPQAGPLGGASDASRCRFPSGASAKRRGHWPLARADPTGLVFIKVHLQGIRRNPASGAPSAERRMLRVAVSLREPRQSVAAVGRSRARTLVSCIYKYAPSGYPPKPRKRGPLGGASQASLNCRFPAGASAKRRGRWPLARANPPGSRPCRHTKKEAQV